MGVIMQAFYWNCLGGKIDDLRAIGFTALWLPPANKAAEVQSMGYDPYDYYDLGDFNQKGGTKTWFGNRGQLMNLIATAHNAGMQVYADVVINHNSGGDATEKNPIDGKTVGPSSRPLVAFFLATGSAFTPPPTRVMTKCRSAICQTCVIAIRVCTRR